MFKLTFSDNTDYVKVQLMTAKCKFLMKYGNYLTRITDSIFINFTTSVLPQNFCK